jgi:hypothetical protein
MFDSLDDERKQLRYRQEGTEDEIVTGEEERASIITHPTHDDAAIRIH